MEKNFLGIDWGKEKIGLALAHGETRVAVPLERVKNDIHLKGYLRDLIVREEIVCVIIGISRRRMEKRETEEGEELGRYLEKEAGVKVEYADEMFTSKLAQEILKERGERRVMEKDDAEAARILLQDWLDRGDAH